MQVDMTLNNDFLITVNKEDGCVPWFLRCKIEFMSLESSIKMMRLDDTNEIIFYQKRGLQYEFSFYGLNAI
jgi:hypothetical protein